MKNITLVTGNKDKVAEYNRMFGVSLNHQSLDVPEIQSLDLEEIAIQKAKEAYDTIQSTVMVEDTALVFHALGHLPGTFIKWFANELDYSGLCDLLTTKKDRSATARACIALYDGREVRTFMGECKGTIAESPRPGPGFGFDCIFIPEGLDTAWSEMEKAEKDTMSHRARALGALKAFLADTRV